MIIVAPLHVARKDVAYYADKQTKMFYTLLRFAHASSGQYFDIGQYFLIMTQETVNIRLMTWSDLWKYLNKEENLRYSLLLEPKFALNCPQSFFSTKERIGFRTVFLLKSLLIEKLSKLYYINFG